MTIRIIKHEAVPQTGSFEVEFPDGRPSVYFYWDDIPGRRVRPDQTESTRALDAAKALARSERTRSREPPPKEAKNPPRSAPVHPWSQFTSASVPRRYHRCLPSFPARAMAA